MAEAQDIDIGDGCREITNDQKDLPGGHSVEDDFVQLSRIGEVLSFERTFDFDCKEVPTSFYMWVKFTLSQDTAVSSHAVVRRTDEGAGTVNVKFETIIFRYGYLQATLVHRFNELGSPEEKTVTSQASISEETAVAFREEGNLRFEFVLTVEGCHREQKGEETPKTASSEDSSPRKRIKV